MYLQFTVRPNGTLRMSYHQKDREEIVDMANNHDEITVLVTGSEQYWTNGSFRPFDGGDANPMVGLTSAPCVAEHMEYDDEGKATIVGRLWYFASYEVESCVERMLERGFVDFSLAPEDTE